MRKKIGIVCFGSASESAIVRNKISTDLIRFLFCFGVRDFNFLFLFLFFFFLFHPLMGRVEDTDISSLFAAAAADVEADILQLLFHVDGHTSGSHLGTQQ